MLLRRHWLAGLVVLVASVAPAQQANKSPAANSFRIDNSRPYVYLLFDHQGSGIPRSEKEPKLRLWFRLENNCDIAIVVTTFGVPDGSPAEEVGVMYEIVINAQPNGVLTEAPSQRQATATQPEVTMPQGTMFDVGSSISIPPGSSILFSVPINHLSRHWHIEIPYRFDLKDSRVPRPVDIGGQPIMRLEYGLGDLPEAVQKALPIR